MIHLQCRIILVCKTSYKDNLLFAAKFSNTTNFHRKWKKTWFWCIFSEDCGCILVITNSETYH